MVDETRTTRLLESCLNAEVIKHPGGKLEVKSVNLLMAGHFVPNAANYRHDIVAFVEKNLPQVNAEETNSKSSI